ncbi:MAG: amidohydrolase, partial [Saprospiraceae bacterium]
MRNIIFLSLLFSFDLAMGQVPTGDMIIRKGTVLTITKGKLTETDILVQKGKITAIGKGLKAPSGTKE